MPKPKVVQSPWVLPATIFELLLKAGYKATERAEDVRAYVTDDLRRRISRAQTASEVKGHLGDSLTAQVIALLTRLRLVKEKKPK